MRSLTPAGPLHGVDPIVRQGVAIHALPLMPIAELRGDRHALAASLPEPELPGANRVARHDGWRALWVRPDGWLLIADDARGDRHWTQWANSADIRLTPLDHGLAALRISGPQAPALLAKGTPLDLRPSRFGAGHCARTWCAGFTVLIEHRDEALDLHVDASQARSFHDWLADAAVDFTEVATRNR